MGLGWNDAVFGLLRLLQEQDLTAIIGKMRQNVPNFWVYAECSKTKGQKNTQNDMQPLKRGWCYKCFPKWLKKGYFANFHIHGGPVAAGEGGIQI